MAITRPLQSETVKGPTENLDLWTCFVEISSPDEEDVCLTSTATTEFDAILAAARLAHEHISSLPQQFSLNGKSRLTMFPPVLPDGLRKSTLDEIDKLVDEDLSK